MSSPVRSILVIGPEPAMVTVEVTVHWSQMVTGTLVLVKVVTWQTGVLVAVGKVPVGVGVMLGVLVGVKVGVEVGHVPALRVNNSCSPVVRPVVLHRYCVKRLPVPLCTPTTSLWVVPPGSVP